MFSVLPSFLEGFFTDFFAAVQVALLPTLASIKASPSLLLQPLALRRVFFAHVWSAFGPTVDDVGVSGAVPGCPLAIRTSPPRVLLTHPLGQAALNEGGRPVKEKLLTPHAYGVVLDIGAGHGHTMRYLDRTRVTRYIALEPNEGMHMAIRRTAAECGFSEYDGSLVILSLDAVDAFTSHIVNPGSVDTLVSILTLCSIPNAERAVHKLVQRFLKPGGQFLFYEHVDSPLDRVRWWQHFLSPPWSACFDGCTLGLPSHRWVEAADEWAVKDVWGKEGESNDNLFYHKVGRFARLKA